MPGDGYAHKFSPRELDRSPNARLEAIRLSFRVGFPFATIAPLHSLRMSAVPQFVGSFCLLVWVYLTFFRGQFWAVRKDEIFRKSSGVQLPSVAVVIPARDEAKLISTPIDSLFRQDYSGRIDVFLVDDNSSDRTAEVAYQAAQRAGALDRFHPLTASPPPPQWTGKLWALSQGLCQAVGLKPDYLLFTDADIFHATDNVDLLVAHAERDELDMASLMVKLHSHTLAERSAMPAFVFFFFMLYPPAWVASSKRKTAAAAGGCILIRPRALERIGGIEAIRGELIDDCALARRVKHSGGRIWLGVSDDTRSLREYGGWAEIEQMISRTAFTQLNYSFALLIATTLGMILTFFAPPTLILFGKLSAFLGLASWLLMSLCFWPTLKLYRLSVLWAPLLPLVAVFYTFATIHSALLHCKGRGGFWKGRTYPYVPN